MFTQTIDSFVKEEIEKPFIWGDTDCCKTSDRWISTVLGFSPMYNFGASYETEEEATEIMAKNGGIVKLVNKAMKQSKIKTIKKPIVGDVGVIVVFGELACMAIKTQDFWFTRNENGVVLAPHDCKLLKAWSICQM